MTMSSSRIASLRTVGVVVLALASGLACTAIFKPKDDVQRCGTSDDCEGTGDNRYEAACRFDPENTDLDSTKIDKICVADFKVQACDPEAIAGTNTEHPYFKQIEDCDSVPLGTCDEDKAGTLGCKAAPGESCQGSLEPNDDGLCVDPDDDERIFSDPDYRDQDVKDQFCKSFFCDERFVCDTSSDKPVCVICDDEADFGSGGCGLLYSNGAPSPTYVLGDDLEDQCDGPDANIDEPVFGECP